jgi:hypothetical protein
LAEDFYFGASCSCVHTKYGPKDSTDCTKKGIKAYSNLIVAITITPVTMFRALVIIASLVSASAFAPVARSSARSSLKVIMINRGLLRELQLF